MTAIQGVEKYDKGMVLSLYVEDTSNWSKSFYWIGAEAHPGVKCPRCWNRHESKRNFENLCDRCQVAIITNYPNHESRTPIICTIIKNAKEDGTY